MTTRAKIIVTVCTTMAVFGIGAYLSVVVAVGGHESYVPMILVFPFSSFVMAAMAMSTGDLSEALLEWIAPGIGILQFASYGFVFGRAWVRGYPKKTGIRLAIFHASVLLLFAGALAVDFLRR